MPFGAELRDDGVRFRLWAPGAKRIEVVIERRHRNGTAAETLPMAVRADGFHELVTERASAGSRYRYRIDGNIEVADPASRANPDDVHGASEVVDPRAFEWDEGGWRGRPWHEAVIYELHVGTFTPEGTFRATMERLPYLASLGVTAIELMPVADFAGRRGWGYDGVLAFAPEESYGSPEDLKALVQAAHRQGLMVLLDVVYNHFGPEGNYLHSYAPAFFNGHRQTLWGPAINFDGEGSRVVRNFFVHNTLYWLEEYRVDGLRYDAVNAIEDHSRPHILEEIAAAAHAGPGRERPIHLVLENDDNAARYLHPSEAAGFRAQWNDDVHHALHVLATGERDGYYADYVPWPAQYLARSLAEGFAYQGETSRFRGGRRRGEPSGALAPTAFVAFLQNHDQVGNRAFGERVAALVPARVMRCLTALLLLAPQPPLLFMGQEFAAGSPFQFFCDFGPDLARAVLEGRRAEFGRFARYSDAAERERIPDPNDPATFRRSRLDWSELDDAQHAAWLAYHRELLAIREREIMPLLPRMPGGAGRSHMLGETALGVEWLCTDGARLTLLTNLGGGSIDADELPPGRLLYAVPEETGATLAGWSVRWYLTEAQRTS
jgi:maltooligosyltrehalose trehalohydrolase